MNKKKTLKKIIPFWEDTEAISPVVATILVLAVAVASGLGLYLWFNPFQASVQTQVGNTSSASIDLMAKKSMGNDAITLSPFPGDSMYTITFAEVDDAGSAPINITTGASLYPQGNAYIGRYYKYNPTYWLKSTSGGNGWVQVLNSANAQIYDERFIVEIPITLSPVFDLRDVIIKAGKPEVVETYPQTTDVNLYHTEYWLHLDKDNHYQLLKKDDTPFEGIMSRAGATTSNINEIKGGDKFYFDGSKYYLKVHTTILSDYKGEDMGLDFDSVVTSNGTAPQYGYPYSTTPGTYFRVLPLYKSNGEKVYSYKHNLTAGADQGWYTNYFTGTNMSQFESGWYKVGSMKARESTTKYLYLMFNGISLPNHPETNDWREGDNEYIVFNVPLTVTSAEGITSTMNVKIKVHDEQ